MSVTPTENRASFWTQPATVLDISKFLLPFVVAPALIWASSVEVRQAKTDARFEQYDKAQTAQNKTLDSIQDTLNKLIDTKDERGQRMARVEAMLQILTQQSMMQQQKASK